jgi:hypothetical protein
MKAISVIVFSVLAFSTALPASESLDKARQLSNSGDWLGAKTLLAQAAQKNPGDLTARGNMPSSWTAMAIRPRAALMKNCLIR